MAEKKKFHEKVHEKTKKFRSGEPCLVKVRFLGEFRKKGKIAKK